MHLVPLLGRQLKEDDIIELLEYFEMEVVYDFDRSHEGMPDKYWASSKEAGFQLRFDAAQLLHVVFLHILPDDEFAAFSQDDCDIPFFKATTQVQAFGEAQGLQVAKGRADFLGVSRDWVRLGFATYSIHYEFHGSNLALVTITQGE